MAETMLRFNIEVDAATGKARLKEFGDEAAKAGVHAEAAGKKIGAQGFGGEILNLRNAVSLFAASAGVAQTISFLKSCATEAMNAQLSSIRLANALTHAGIGGEGLARELEKSAFAISQMTMLDDDAAVSLTAVGVNMGLTADQAQRLTIAAADAAAAMGKGPESIAAINEALARSISSGSTKALRQLGINIDEVKFAAGDAEPVLRELNRKFGGAAQAEMDSYAGKVHQISVEYRNLKESIGSFLMDYATNIAAFLRFDIGEATKPLQESIYKQIGIMDEAAPKTEWLGRGLQNYIDKIPPAVTGQVNLNEVLQDSTDTKTKAAEKTKTLADAIWDLLGAYNSVEAKAARFVETLKNPPRLPTQRYEQVGMTPYAPPATMTEGATSPGQGVFAEFPSSWSEETVAYAESLKIVGENMRDIIELSAIYQENLDLQTAKTQTLRDVTQMITGAMAQFAGQLVYAALMGEQVTARMLKSMLASIAAEATTKAIFELAEGWASSATGNAPAAAAHFMAAKIYGLVAGVAAAASMAVGGSGRSTSTGRYSRSRTTKEAETTTAATREVNVTVYLEGHGIITDPAAFSREIIEQTKRQMSKSGQS